MKQHPSEEVAVFREKRLVGQMVGEGASAERPGWIWRPGDRKVAWLCAVLISISLLYQFGIFEADRNSAKGHPFGDFFAIWSYAKILLDQHAAVLYDNWRLHEAQVALGMLPGEQNPFPYPPTFLLLIWPLGLLSFYPAYVAWTGGTLLLYLMATCTGRTSKAGIIAALLLAPTTSICVMAGQSGFLLGALLVGGLLLIPTRPVLAGVLFGLLTYKPQFGVMIPIGLIAARQWTCITAACATTAGLVMMTSAVFGISIWAAWLHALPEYAAWFDKVTVASQHMPTVLTNLQILGFSQTAARGGQLMAAMFAGALVWKAWRRPAQPSAVPILLAAAYLATPHAFIYDLPALLSAVALFAADRLRMTDSLLLPEVGVLACVLLFPISMTIAGLHAPVSTGVISVFLALLAAPADAAWRQSRQLGVEPLPQEAAG